MRTAGGIAAAGAAAIVAFVLMIAIIVGSDNHNQAGNANGGTLNTATLPAPFTPWLTRAGALCQQIGPPLLAAQLRQESNFNPAAVSAAGAQGAAQFLPGTWPSWGHDDDGNGVASPFDIGDAVMAQARYMCALASQMAQALATGRVQGSVQDLALAAYNAGPGAVLAAGGIPHNGETDAYVTRINAALSRFAATTQPTLGQPAPSPAPAQPMAPNAGGFPFHVILAGQRWLGQPPRLGRQRRRPHPRKAVTVSALDTGYYRTQTITARRLG